MASPFTVFRRNQKIMLAFLCLMAMVSFVFLGPFTSYYTRSQRQDPLVVETKYGNLHDAELQILRSTRRMVQEFIRQLVSASIVQLIEKKEVDPRMADHFLQMMAGRALQVMDRPAPPGSETAAVQTFVLAKRAEEAGMIVSDTVVNDYLKQCSMDQLDDAQIARIINSLRSQNLPMSEGRLFEALRRELLAYNYSQMFIVDLDPMPPAQRWDYFERLNRRAQVELLAVPVASFVSKVPDPSDAEAKQYFEEYKNRLPEPGSPEPGFKQPQKAAFQYFKADFNQFVERAEKDVTDEQIREYYEKNKDARFRQAQLPPEAESKPAKPEEKPAAEPAKTEDKSSEKAEENKPQPKAETQPPAKPADQPAPDKTDDSGKQQAAPKSASAAGGASVRLVSNVELAQADAGKSPPSSAQPPAGEAKPAADSAPPASGEPQPAAADSKPAAADAKPAAPPAEVKYEPLDKVQGDIRKELARTKAREALDKTIGELESLMRRYADEQVLYEAQVAADTKGAGAPAPLDFDALAKEHGMTAETTGLVSAEELRAQWDIGRSNILVPDARARGGLRIEPFGEIAFDEATARFKPLMSQDSDLHFLAWKTKTVDERVPELDEVRPEVVRAWKMIKARKLAEEQADKYMAEAKKDKATLEAAFGKQPELQVVKPPLFSWLTTGSVALNPSNLPRISDVPGIEQPGSAFMEAVFRLEPGEFDVTSNRPETTVYVVHLLSYDRQLDALFDQFAQEPARMYQSVMGEDYFQPALQSWIKHLMKEADVRWEREPVVERMRM